MTLAQLLVLGVVVGSNNLAVALAIGAVRERPRRGRIVGVFVVLEFLIPLLGMGLGRAATTFLGQATTWIAAGVLLAFGAWTVLAGIRHRDIDETLLRRLDSFRGLILLGLGLSVDNLIVGFSLGLRQLSPWVLAATIAIFSGAFAWVGIGVGRRMRRHWEGIAAIAAGALLIGLGMATALGWM